MKIKVNETGSLSWITSQIFNEFLNDLKIVPGEHKVTSSSLYQKYLEYLGQNNYASIPSLRAFGRVAAGALPYVRRSCGTCYLINRPF